MQLDRFGSGVGWWLGGRREEGLSMMPRAGRSLLMKGDGDSGTMPDG